MKSSAVAPAIALCAALSALSPAAAEPPAPKDCLRAYMTLDAFRTEVRTLEATPAAAFHGLGAYVDGFDLIDFRNRAEALDKKFPDTSWDGGVLGAALASGPAQERMIGESTGAALNALLAPEKTFAEQRAVFARARACDIAYGFAPLLGEAPAPERTLALLREQADRRTKEKSDRLAALDDEQCTVRFVLTANLFQPGSPGQQEMNGRAEAAAVKAIGATQDMPKERFAQLIQREAMERAEKFKNGAYKAAELVEEVNACERRLGMPVTDLKPK